MTAKEYLMQLQVLDTKIAQEREEVRTLKSLVTGGGGQQIREHVQTSPKNRQEDIIVDYRDLEEKIKTQLRVYVYRRNDMVTEIHKITGQYADLYIRILYDHYVPDINHKVKSLEQIAVDMSFHYDYVRHLHGRALLEFSKIMKLSTK